MGEQFAFTFDLGDEWEHLGTVLDRPAPDTFSHVNPAESPFPVAGWGALPAQYGRRWEGDDGDGAAPEDPQGSDLPPALAHWAH